MGVDFRPLNATARAEAVAKLDYFIEPLRKLAPDMGAYMNEVCLGHPLSYLLTGVPCRSS